MTKATYRLTYKKSVDKDLRKLTLTTRKQIIKKIQALALNAHPSASTKLRGSTNLYRLRHGDYRVIYQIKDGELTILVIKVGHRKEVYR